MVDSLIEGFKLGSVRCNDDGYKINIKYEGFKLTPALVVKAATRFYEANKDINISSITVDASNTRVKKSVLVTMQDLSSEWCKLSPRINVITPFIEEPEVVMVGVTEKVESKQEPVKKRQPIRRRTRIIR